MARSHIQHYHLRTMQNRYKHKLAPYQQRQVVFPGLSRHTIFFIILACLALVLGRRLSFLPSFTSRLPLNSASDPNHPNSHLFRHGAIPVDKVIWYEGDGPSNSHKKQQSSQVQPATSVPVQAETAPVSTEHISQQIEKQTQDQPQDQPQEQSHNIEKASIKQEDTSQQKESPSDELKNSSHDIEIKNDNDNVPKPSKSSKDIPLKDVLNFTPKTAINFMHFHKTGGVSFKTSLHQFYNDKYKKNGDRVIVKDACYSREGVNMEDPTMPTFLQWRCDWEPIRQMNEEQRNKHDFIFGHQFWGNGAGTLLSQRDLRSFTILRHPFDRKVSFYYHFFVREVGRKEEDVTYEEIRDFLLFDKLTIQADLGRDLGPNYMAGRLLSDGIDGFIGNKSYSHYEINQDSKYQVAEKAKSLLRDYIFVGLQMESNAAKCMLRKVVETFNEVNGVDNSGVEQIDKDAKILNTGSYSLSAKAIWAKFTDADRVIFDRKERVDLLIYEEGERLFRRHAKLFGCTGKVKDPKYKL